MRDVFMRYQHSIRRVGSQWPSRGVLFALLMSYQPVTPDVPLKIDRSETGTAQPALAPNRPVTPPVAADLQLDIPDDALDTLDLVSLSRCTLQTTVRKYNSRLGQHAKPSQRLLLALEYLRLAPPCIELLRNRHPALVNILDATWHQRQTQLPALIFNATLGSDEYRSLWLNPRAPAAYPPARSTAAVSALQVINRDVRRWLSGDYQAQNRDFELLLSEVAGGDAMAMLQQSRPRRGEALDAEREGNDMQTLLGTITNLEIQLASALPLRYRRWVNDRNDRNNWVRQNAEAQQQQLLKYLQQCCSIN